MPTRTLPPRECAYTTKSAYIIKNSAYTIDQCVREVLARRDNKCYLKYNSTILPIYHLAKLETRSCRYIFPAKLCIIFQDFWGNDTQRSLSCTWNMIEQPPKGLTIKYGHNSPQNLAKSKKKNRDLRSRSQPITVIARTTSTVSSPFCYSTRSIAQSLINLVPLRGT